jgi:hypothetical protein
MGVAGLGIGVGGDGGLGGGEFERKDLVDGEILGGEDAVEAFEGKGTFLIEEIRYMGLAERGDAGAARPADSLVAG